MPGRRGIENDMVEAARLVGQQARELVERGDLRSAGAGKLLAHRLPGLVIGSCVELRQDAAAIGLGCGRWIDVEHGQQRDTGHGERPVAERHPEHLVEVRGRIGADQQDGLAGVGQMQRGGTGDRSLPDTALAREKQEAGQRVAEEVERHGADAMRETGQGT